MSSSENFHTIEQALFALRPQPTHEFIVALDQQVTSGFGRDASKNSLADLIERVRSFFSWRRASASLAVAFTAVVAVVVVGNNSGTISQKEGVTPPATSSLGSKPDSSLNTSPQAQQADGEAGALPEKMAGDVAAPTPSEHRRTIKGKQAIERSATLELSAPGDEIQSVSDRVFKVIAGVDGVVLDSSIQTGDTTSGSASFSLQVPSKNLSKTMAELSDLAHVTARSEDTLNVTENVASASERLADAKAERKSLLKALGNAGSDSQIESIRSRLELNKSQIDQARGDLRSLNNRTSYSKIDLTISEANGNSTTGGWGINDAADDALRVLEVAAGVALMVLAIGLPSVALIAAFLWLSRRNRKLRREAVLSE